MKFLKLLIASVLFLSACSEAPPEDVTPYTATALADLEAGTKLEVYGNGMGWSRRYNDTGWGKNSNGPKLQRLITTDTDETYVAVFRNWETEEYYGRDTFVMPAAYGGEASGTTDLGYKYTITRGTEGLIYTVSGLFTIAMFAGPDETKYAGGGFAAGSSTGDDAMPTEGTANYSGRFIGNSTFDGTVTGLATMEVDFDAGTNQISGLISGLDSVGSYVFNDLIIEATFLPEAEFLGILSVDPFTAVGKVFSVGTTGQIKGGFFGPSADEFGATIRIADGNDHILSGSLSGTLDP